MNTPSLPMSVHHDRVRRDALFTSPTFAAVALIAVQLAGGWLAAYLIGGASHVTPIWFYFPVLYAGIRFGIRGAVATGVAAGVLAGPLLPLDVDSATPQPVLLWGIRASLLVGLGAAVTAVLDCTMLPIRAERDTRTLRHALRQALHRGDLVLHYQPILSIADHRIVGFEALIRWNHPERGLVPPGQFIPVAEESGLIVPIGAWALEEACRQASWWQEHVPRDARSLAVAVNVSGRQLSAPGLLTQVQAALRDSGIDHACLDLEVTETALMEDIGISHDRLVDIREAGIRVAVDDFGTGYASLTYLRDLPVDVVKIDRLFVSELEGNPKDRAIVEGVISLAHALGKEVVAEGVETAAQFEILAALGCDLAQGWHIGRPETADVVTTRLVREGIRPVLPWGSGDLLPVPNRAA